MKYTCLFFSEGGEDKKFLMALIDLPKFRFHTKKWHVSVENATGESPEVILGRCKKVITTISYDLVVCFIDLDVLKKEHPRVWEKEKQRLEQKYSEIFILWQIDNLEDEFRKVLSDLPRRCGKSKINALAKLKIAEFVNSDLWKRILKPIQDRESKLEVEK